MLVLEPALSEVPAIVDRLETEIAEFVAGLSSGEPLADVDAAEHAAYVAALRHGVTELRWASDVGSARWPVFEAERGHVNAFMKDAALDALQRSQWALLAAYAECLRRLNEVS